MCVNHVGLCLPINRFTCCFSIILVILKTNKQIIYYAEFSVFITPESSCLLLKLSEFLGTVNRPIVQYNTLYNLAINGLYDSIS